MSATIQSKPKTIRSGPDWLAGAVAAIFVAAAGAVLADVWTAAIGAYEISPAGRLAMGSGVILTLALGVGLIAIAFISNRRGYVGDRRKRPTEPAARGRRTNFSRANRGLHDWVRSNKDSIDRTRTGQQLVSVQRLMMLPVTVPVPVRVSMPHRQQTSRSRRSGVGSAY
jgi:hypothetical protein